MKIYSKFSDYYDSVQAYGADPKVFYNRKTRVITDGNNKFKSLINNSSINSILDLNKYNRSNFSFGVKTNGLYLTHQILIFFCGEVYPLFVFEYGYRDDYNSYFNYNIEDVYDLIGIYGSKKQKDSWFRKRATGFYLTRNCTEVPALFSVCTASRSRQLAA